MGRSGNQNRGMSAIITHREREKRFGWSARRGVERSACRALLRDAAGRFWGRRNQDREARRGGPVSRMGTPVCERRVCILSGSEPEQAIGCAELRSSTGSGSAEEAGCGGGYFHHQSAFAGFLEEARDRC